MIITYLDSDTGEVIKQDNCPSGSYTSEVKPRAEKFASTFSAKIVGLTSYEENEWTIELKIPLRVRKAHTPLPGDRVRFQSTTDGHELTGTYHFKHHRAYVVFDDSGVKWEITSMWQMSKL